MQCTITINYFSLLIYSCNAYPVPRDSDTSMPTLDYYKEFDTAQVGKIGAMLFLNNNLMNDDMTLSLLIWVYSD